MSFQMFCSLFWKGRCSNLKVKEILCTTIVLKKHFLTTKKVFFNVSIYSIETTTAALRTIDLLSVTYNVQSNQIKSMLP